MAGVPEASTARRRGATAALLAALMLGCAHNAPPPTSTPGEVIGSWAAYGIILAAGAEKAGKYDFSVEVDARGAIAEGWRKRADKGTKDPYLDLLADVLEAGLMREYVLAYLARPGWTVPAADVARLDFGKWESWQPSHLPPDHRAVTGAVVSGLRDPPVPGANLPGREIDPAQSSCEAVRPALERALADWDRQERELPALPLSIQLENQIMPAFKEAARSPRARQNGIVLVSPRALNVAFVAGFCAVDRGEWAVAERLLRRAVALSPGSGNVRAELVQSLIMQKRLDQADAELNAALELPDTACRKAVLWRKRGYILFDRGKLVDSYRAYAHSLEFDAASPLARSEMSLIVKTLRAAGTYDEKVLGPLLAPAAAPGQMHVTNCPP